jgi:hypothetical protein
MAKLEFTPGETPMTTTPASDNSVFVRAASRDRIGPLPDINAQCLQWMIEGLRESTVRATGIMAECGGVLASLSASQRAAVAHFPFLLVDLRFSEPLWWSDVVHHPNYSPSAPSWLAPMPRQASIRLARSVLVLSWHTATVDRDAAIVVLGLHEDTADIHAKLSLQAIDRIAEQQYRHLRPRWEDRPLLWKQLLASAQHPQMDPDGDLVLRAMQFAAGALVNQRLASAAR